MHVEPSLLYRTRGGLIVGPLVHRPSSNKARWPWPWAWPDGRVVLADGPAINLCWDDHGHYYGADEPHELDLVAACGEPTEAPANESEPPAPTEAHSQPPANESGNALIAQAVRETAVSLQRFADLLLALADHAAQDPARPSVDTTGTAQQLRAEAEAKAAAAREAAGWVDWRGGPCPLAAGTLVEVAQFNGGRFTAVVGSRDLPDHRWRYDDDGLKHDDILAYRVIKEPAESQEATGWVEWRGGTCPLATGTLVEVRYRNGLTHTGKINDVSEYGILISGRHYGLEQAYWYRDQLANDIVAYRIIKEPKHR